MARNLKVMREERNDLLTAGKAIAEKAEKENRSLNAEEIRSLSETKNQIETLETEIQAIKEFRATDKKAEKVESVETRKDKKEKDAKKVNEKQKEVRSALTKYLRTGRDAEYRSVDPSLAAGNADENVAGNGGVIVPTDVENSIIHKLDEQAPVFANSRKFTSAVGALKVPREKALAQAGFVGEGVDLSKLTPHLGTVTLNGHRVGASLQLTSEMLNDTGLNLIEYSTDFLTRALGRALERAILLGKEDGQEAENTFKPVIGDKDIKDVALAGELPTTEELIGVVTALHPDYLKGAIMVVSRKMFDAIAKLKDGDGAYLLFKAVVGDRPEYRFQGVPVYVSDALQDAEKQIIIGNFGQGYGLMVKQGVHMVHVTQDTTQALAGGHLIVLDALMDGAVINPDAFVTVSAKKA